MTLGNAGENRVGLLFVQKSAEHERTRPSCLDNAQSEDDDSGWLSANAQPPNRLPEVTRFPSTFIASNGHKARAVIFWMSLAIRY
jgi:hypothetical protein